MQHIKFLKLIGWRVTTILALASIFYVLLNLPAFIARTTVIKPRQLSYLPPVLSRERLPDQIVIPRLHIKSPVLFDRDAANEAELMDSLKKGVTHLLGTARPGEQGNSVIVGHSSNYFWETGDYNYIFANLDKIQAGDQILLIRNNQQYSYRVEHKGVVKPTELSVVSQAEQNVLTLITCTPVGTTLRRLVVVARQLSPDPAHNSAFSGQPLVGSLPAPR